ncbi:lectin-like isoform X2 [Ambystoma mexicanum]
MERVLWPDAEAKCLTHESHLASIHSSEENEFVFNLMGRPLNHNAGKAYWIGGHDTFQEGTHMWTDGTKMTFLQFGFGQPDNPGNEHYIGSWYIENGTITWNDYPRHITFPFICKYYLGNRLCSNP